MSETLRQNELQFEEMKQTNKKKPLWLETENQRVVQGEAEREE